MPVKRTHKSPLRDTLAKNMRRLRYKSSQCTANVLPVGGSPDSVDRDLRLVNKLPVEMVFTSSLYPFGEDPGHREYPAVDAGSGFCGSRFGML